jgi:hypothetical protein
MRIRSFISLLFISLIFSCKSLATKNTQNTNYLSKQCKKELLDSKIENPTFKLFKTSEIGDYLPLIIKRKGPEGVNIETVSIDVPNIQTIYGLKFTWENQSIIDCRSFYHTPKISLIEQYDDYDSVLMKSLDAIKISTLYYVKCGSPCNYSEVKSTIITKSRYIPPDVYDEISTPLFEYPSQFFADYLTLEELYQFLVLYDEFEWIKWRGKIYNTNELRKIYEK